MTSRQAAKPSPGRSLRAPADRHPSSYTDLDPRPPLLPPVWTPKDDRTGPARMNGSIPSPLQTTPPPFFHSQSDDSFRTASSSISAAPSFARQISNRSLTHTPVPASAAAGSAPGGQESAGESTASERLELVLKKLAIENKARAPFPPLLLAPPLFVGARAAAADGPCWLPSQIKDGAENLLQVRVAGCRST